MPKTVTMINEDHLEEIKDKLTILQYYGYSFQLHHKMPYGILKRTYYELVSNQIMYLGMPILLMTILFYKVNFIGNYLYIFFLLLNFLTVHSQWTHKMAHKQYNKNIIIKYLQKLKIILPSESHHQHHTTYDNHFSILNGWSNNQVDKLYKFMIKTSIIKKTKN